ncbi:STAS domain-containing protein [Vreelandella venusta]|uniref:STAS domain-containing protein n=1 Tax=Vreelandella venusta TaxID=44935 RepID=UPI00384CB7F4
MNTQSPPWKAPSSLTIYEIRALEEAFIASGSANADRTWDLSDVQEVDSCGIQWLVTVRARLRAQECTLTLLHASDDFVEKLSFLGLSFLLSPSVEETSHV